MKRKVALMMAAVFVLATPLTGCAIGDTEFVLDLNSVGKKDYVFSINGTTCSQEEAKLYLCNYQNIYGYEYGVNLWKQDFGQVVSEDSLENYVKDVTLSELANIVCMNLLAKEQELTLTEVEKTRVKVAAEEYYDSLSNAEISYMGIDKNMLAGFYEKYAIAQKLFDTLTQGVNEEVSDDEARVIRIQQIYVKDQKTAEQVKTKLAGKDDFATMASNYNEADTIEITLKRGVYPAEVDAVAFQLDNGEQSDMIATSDGYYFIKCISKYEKELTEQNKIDIIAQRRKEQFEDLFQGFVKESVFEMNEEMWESIEIDTSGAITTNSFFDVYNK